MIDDIAYLKENSVSDSIAFYVDSSARDHKYFPTPSEYSISFEQPFKFVYGFDVLDASIPTTQYNIENNNNDLAITAFAVPTGNELGDIVPYIEDIVHSKDFIGMFEDTERNVALLINEDTATTYSLSALSSSIDTTAYYAYVWKQLADVPIELKRYQVPEDYFFFVFENKEYAIQVAGNESIIDIISYENFALRFMSGGSLITYYEVLKLDNLTYNLLENNGDFIMSIDNIRITIDIGNYDIGTLRNELNTLVNTYAIELETTTSIETRQGKYKITASQRIMILNGHLSTIRENIGFSQLPNPALTSNYRCITVGDNPYVYMSIYDDFYQVYKLEGPGLVNLFGERYVILRIKEIEDHLLGSFGYMSFSPGIGMFKLASTFNDVTNLRFDYVSLVRKPFHPIGKINKLTFRFETAKGKIYDFKGVNHQMLMVVKFLVPTQKLVFQRSVLNPNYDPDFVKYLARNQTIRNKEDSDDEEQFDDDDNKQQYKKMLAKYDFSSSEESDEDVVHDIKQLQRQRMLKAI